MISITYHNTQTIILPTLNFQWLTGKDHSITGVLKLFLRRAG